MIFAMYALGIGSHLHGQAVLAHRLKDRPRLSSWNCLPTACPRSRARSSTCGSRQALPQENGRRHPRRLDLGVGLTTSPRRAIHPGYATEIGAIETRIAGPRKRIGSARGEKTRLANGMEPSASRKATSHGSARDGGRLRPDGVLDWQDKRGYSDGLRAKEIVVSTYGVIYHPDRTRRRRLNVAGRLAKSSMTPLKAFAYGLHPHLHAVPRHDRGHPPRDELLEVDRFLRHLQASCSRGSWPSRSSKAARFLGLA